MSTLLCSGGIVLLLAVTLFIGWYFSADARAKRAMKAIPRRLIGEVMEGERVRIVGRLEVDEPIRSPLSGRPCAHWRVRVQQRVRRGRSNRWRTIVDEGEGVDFFLHDPTGKALVRTIHSKAVLDRDESGGSGILNEPSEALQIFLAERGIDSQGWIFNKRIRYHEGVAEPGETVAVVGTGRWERDPDEDARAGQGYREATSPKRLVMSAPADGSPLLLSDETDVTSA